MPSMAEQQKSPTPAVRKSIRLPPPDSITLGEIENRLIFVTSQSSAAVDEFLSKRGKIFKSIAIPSSYLQRYASNTSSIERERSSPFTSIATQTRHALSRILCSLYNAWSIASPLSAQSASRGAGGVGGAGVIQKHRPSITQQSINHYDAGVAGLGPLQLDSIVKFDYHPLYRKLCIAFKHGVVFFDLKKNNWIGNTLQHPQLTDITDFQFSHSGHLLCIACASGVFVWDLSTFRGELIAEDGCDAVTISPCDKYMAVYKGNGGGSGCVTVYDVCTNEMVYRHRMWHRIQAVQWVSSTKHNKFCPLRLAIMTHSPFIFLLNMVTFETATYECDAQQTPTSMVVSQKGDGVMVVLQRQFLYYIPLKAFSEPQFLADLSIEMQVEKNSGTPDGNGAPPAAANTSAEVLVNDGDGREENEDEDAKLQELPRPADAAQEQEKRLFVVRDIEWSPCDRRLAVLYDECKTAGEREPASFVSVAAYEFGWYKRMGFITLPRKPSPLQVRFRKHVADGALMAVCWNNGVISQCHLCFDSSMRTY